MEPALAKLLCESVRFATARQIDAAIAGEQPRKQSQVLRDLPGVQLVGARRQDQLVAPVMSRLQMLEEFEAIGQLVGSNARESRSGA